MPRPLRSFRTPALILKRRDLGEADRLLTLFTPEYGKIDAVAKGARKPTSTKTGHVELYTRADVLIAKGRDLDVLVQVEMQEPFLALREDLVRGAYASYAVELLDRFAYGADEADAHMLFVLLNATLERLCSAEDPRLAMRYYEVHLLEAVGFRPELSECVITREALRPIDQYFSFADGGVVSPEGVAGLPGMAALPLNTLKLLRHLQRSPYSHVAALSISEALHRDVERILLGYLGSILESRLQSIDFLRRIRRN